MDATASVSKGCFAFPAPAKGKKTTKNPLDFSQELWYDGYSTVWKAIVDQLDNLEDRVIETLLQDLLGFISSSPSLLDTQIPAAAILTGINLPDHESLFGRLKSRLSEAGAASGVAVLSSADCCSVKHAVERCVAQLMESSEELSYHDDEDDDDVERLVDLKRSQCTLPNLLKWYQDLNTVQHSPFKKKKSLNNGNTKKLVVVLKDFETFNPTILSTLIQIFSGYTTKLPIVLVFGIATSLSAVDQILPHSSMSRLSLKAFQAQPSVYFLNNTLNKVFLSPNCPFQLGGKLFNFFTQVFLFYDFSVNRFTQGVKYCVMEHFRDGGRAVALLCCPQSKIKNRVEKLDRKDLEYIRKLKSFKGHSQSIKDEQKQKKLTSDDSFTKKEILNLMTELRQHITDFYVALSLLHSLVAQLPQSPLGKQFREMYSTAMCKDIWTTSEYKECRTLLGFLSKDELVDKVTKLLSILSESSESSSMKEAAERLSGLMETVRDAGITRATRSPVKSPSKSMPMAKNRAQLMQKVFELGSADKYRSAYERAREALLEYLMNELLPAKLVPFTKVPLWEMVTLVESEARYRVVPRIRAPIHTALNNPAHYLVCRCCKIKEGDEIVASMPDLCIAYKLHLESGSLINMYDWLQSFDLLVNGARTGDEDVDLKIQARFTQAVSEMEFLGFVKSSKKKTDHVARLTWGGSAT